MPDAAMKEWTVHGFLEGVASDEPVPGGGAVAALAGAAAVALLRMVISLAARRAKDPAGQPALAALADRARTLQKSFEELADADVAAYRGVADVLSLPRSTDEEKAHRAEQLQRALAHAAEVPLDTARRAAQALGLAGEVAPVCPRVARSDLVTALHLARAACASALANVDANALSLDESPFRRQLAQARASLAVESQSLFEETLAPLDTALSGWVKPRESSPA